ncbi:MAG: ester cyclase [Deferrisomatales bacterium]|nr:ester cyclase [Deferrisomatales bacterium]
MTNAEIVGLVGNSVFNQHDFSVLADHVREDYIQHNPLVPQGRSGFEAFFRDAFRAVPDWSYALNNSIAAGDFVWVYGAYSGTHSGEWLGIPASGKAFSFHAVDIFRLEDGRLAEHWDVMDVYGLFQQLGVIA